jgi:hypothetical protein
VLELELKPDPACSAISTGANRAPHLSGALLLPLIIMPIIKTIQRLGRALLYVGLLPGSIQSALHSNSLR